MTISKTQTFSSIQGDVTLSADIAPCSWMYSGYGMQITVHMPSGGKASISNKALKFESATEAEIQAMVDQVRIVQCSCCGAPAFDPATVNTNRDGKCEKCFMAKLNAEFEKEHEREKKALAKLDAKYKKQGFTHRVDAWIHPSSGDDYQVAYWMSNPTAKEIQAQIRKKKSTVLTDYTLTELL